MTRPDYAVRISRAAIEDLRRIALHLEETTGDIALALRRVREIRDFALTLGRLPHQGTQRDDILSGLRIRSKGRAIIAFRVDDQNAAVRVLRFFYGGQDYEALIRQGPRLP